MNRRLSYILLLFLLLSISSYAQSKSSNIKPKWLTMQDERSTDGSYSFIITEGEGTTVTEAKQKCFINLTTKLEHERGISVTSILNATSTMNRNKSDISYDAMRVFKISYKESGKEIKVKSRVIDEYWFLKNGTFYCYTLFTVPNTENGSSLIDDISVSAKYETNGLWRSAIIPGWGQFYKGSKAKGGIMLGGTVALAGVAVFAENKRSNHMRNLAESYGTDTKRYYADKADQMSTVRNICIGGAAALYVYNLIDAIVAPGAKRVKVTKRGNPKPSFSFTPTAGYNINGVAMACTF